MPTESEIIVVQKDADDNAKKKDSKVDTKIEDVFIRKGTSNNVIDQQLDNSTKHDSNIFKSKEEGTNGEVIGNEPSKDNKDNTCQRENNASLSPNSPLTSVNMCLDQVKPREEISDSDGVPIRRQNSARHHSFLFIPNNNDDDDASKSEKNTRTSVRKPRTSNASNIPKIDHKFKVRDFIARRFSGVKLVPGVNKGALNKSPSHEKRLCSEKMDLSNNNKRPNESSKNLVNTTNENTTVNQSAKIPKIVKKTLHSTTELAVKKDMNVRKTGDINSKTTLSLVSRDSSDNKKLNLEQLEKILGNSTNEQGDASHNIIECNTSLSRSTTPKIRKNSEKMKIPSFNSDLEREIHDLDTPVVQSSSYEGRALNKKCVNIPIKCETKESVVASVDKNDETGPSKREKKELPSLIAQNQSNTNTQKTNYQNNENLSLNDAKNTLDLERAKVKRGVTSFTKLLEKKTNVHSAPPCSSVSKRHINQRVSTKQGITNNSKQMDGRSKVITSESYVILTQNNTDQKSDKRFDESNNYILKIPHKSMQNLSEQISRKTQIPLPSATQSVGYFQTQNKPLFKIHPNSHHKIFLGDEVKPNISPKTTEDKGIPLNNVSTASDIVIKPTVQLTPSKLKLMEKTRRVAQKLSIATRHIINESWATDIKASENNSKNVRWIKTKQDGSKSLSEGSVKIKPSGDRFDELSEPTNVSGSKIEAAKIKLYNAENKKRQHNLLKPGDKNVKKSEVSWKTSMSKNSAGTHRSSMNLHFRDNNKQKINNLTRKGTTIRSVSKCSSQTSEINKNRIRPRSRTSSSKSSNSKIVLSDNSAHYKHGELTEKNTPDLAKKSVSGMIDKYKYINTPCKTEKNYIQLNILRARERRSRYPTLSQKHANLVKTCKGIFPNNTTEEPHDSNYIQKSDATSNQNNQINEARDSEDLSAKASFKYPNDIIFNVPTFCNAIGSGVPQITYTAHKVISTYQDEANNVKKPFPSMQNILAKERSNTRQYSEGSGEHTRTLQRVGRNDNKHGDGKSVHSITDKYKSEKDRSRKEKDLTKLDESNRNIVNPNVVDSHNSKINSSHENPSSGTRRGVSHSSARQKPENDHFKLSRDSAKRVSSNNKNERVQSKAEKSSDKISLESDYSDKKSVSTKNVDISRPKWVPSNLNTVNSLAERSFVDRKSTTTKNIAIARSLGVTSNSNTVIPSEERVFHDKKGNHTKNVDILRSKGALNNRNNLDSSAEKSFSDKKSNNTKNVDTSRSRVASINSNNFDSSTDKPFPDKKSSTKSEDIARSKQETNSFTAKRKLGNHGSQKERDRSDRSEEPESANSAGKIKKNNRQRGLISSSKVHQNIEKYITDSTHINDPEPKSKLPLNKKFLRSPTKEISATGDTTDGNDVSSSKTDEINVKVTNITSKGRKSISARDKMLYVAKVGDPGNTRTSRNRYICNMMDLTSTGDVSEKTHISYQQDTSEVSNTIDNVQFEAVPIKKRDSAKSSSARKTVISNIKDESKSSKSNERRGVEGTKYNVSRPKTANILSTEKPKINDPVAPSNLKSTVVESRTLESQELGKSDMDNREDVIENKNKIHKNASNRTTFRVNKTVIDSKTKSTTQRISATNRETEGSRKKTNSLGRETIHSRKTAYSSRTCVDITEKEQPPNSKVISEHSLEPRKIRSFSSRPKESLTQSRLHKKTGISFINTTNTEQHTGIESMESANESINDEINNRHENSDASDPSGNENQTGVALEVLDSGQHSPDSQISTVQIIDATDMNNGRVVTRANLLCLQIQEVSSNTDLSKASHLLNSAGSHSNLLGSSQESFTTQKSDKSATSKNEENLDGTLVIGDISQGIAVIIRPKSKVSSDKEKVEGTKDDDQNNDNANTNPNTSRDLEENIPIEKDNNEEKSEQESIQGWQENNITSNKEVNTTCKKSQIKMKVKKTNEAPSGKELSNIQRFSKGFKNPNIPPKKIEFKNKFLTKKVNNVSKVNVSTELKVSENLASGENQIIIENIVLTTEKEPVTPQPSEVISEPNEEEPEMPQPVVHAITILTRVNNETSKHLKEKTNKQEVSAPLTKENNDASKHLKEKTYNLKVSDSLETNFSETCDEELAFLTASDSERFDFSNETETSSKELIKFISNL